MRSGACVRGVSHLVEKRYIKITMFFNRRKNCDRLGSKRSWDIALRFQQYHHFEHLILLAQALSGIYLFNRHLRKLYKAYSA
jgi:hypothetical protein